jgi:hypothetical protein
MPQASPVRSLDAINADQVDRRWMTGTLALLGGAGRPRTCDRAVMSRLL